MTLKPCCLTTHFVSTGFAAAAAPATTSAQTPATSAAFTKDVVAQRTSLRWGRVRGGVRVPVPRRAGRRDGAAGRGAARSRGLAGLRPVAAVHRGLSGDAGAGRCGIHGRVLHL